MKTSNMEIWEYCKSVPGEAKKEIKGGRLKGMTDIRPQWRLKILTEVFGVCGFGWKYKTREYWITDGPDNTKSAHVVIELFIKIDDKWSDAIEGQGGSMIISKESNGLYHSDEAYKMATTDAISVACKQLGIGSDVYMGYSNSKYKTENTDAWQTKKQDNNYKNNLDYNVVDKELAECKTEKEIDNYSKILIKEYSNMTPKQKDIVKPKFDKRRSEIKTVGKAQKEFQGEVFDDSNIHY